MDASLVQALQKPIVSPDGRFLAVVNGDDAIRVVRLSNTGANRPGFIVTRVIIPASARQLVRQSHLLRWSPEAVLNQGLHVDSPTIQETETVLLLFSNGKRAVVLSLDLSSLGHGNTNFVEEDATASIVADYQLGDQFGRLKFLDFVLGHRHALAMFEFSPNAIMLDLTQPQRVELAGVKYSDAKGFAKATDSHRFALLRRERGQDKITVFDIDGNHQILPKSFDIHTSDAQGLMFCPNGSPLMAVWDSASYGVKVLFYTGQGHALKQLDITPEHVTLGKQPLDVHGIGLTCWQWQRGIGQTLQAVGDGTKHVMVRYQMDASMKVRTLANFVHPDIINGGETIVWQEMQTPSSPLSSWKRESSVFSATNGEPDTPTGSHVESIQVNCDHSLIATKIRGFNTALWIWQPSHDEPYVVLLFKNPIKTILWHPELPTVLIILTTQHAATLYAWHQADLPPISGTVFPDVQDSGSGSNKSSLAPKHTAAWLPSASCDSGRVPLLFSSQGTFDIGLLRYSDGTLAFESLLRLGDNYHGDFTFTNNIDDSNLDTPSKIRERVRPNVIEFRQDPSLW
ncbi:hypothetical protein B0A52_04155 [Exophiala mesophila]|uniref:Uncharacterized protein n=1 Tax=Exophiala mesophila TaxID=212818 RepID=A0A438NAW4_EXOME|nr:hypothetical protein B0A52_04155 [Exophiala mesophila]